MGLHILNGALKRRKVLENNELKNIVMFQTFYYNVLCSIQFTVNIRGEYAEIESGGFLCLSIPDHYREGDRSSDCAV